MRWIITDKENGQISKPIDVFDYIRGDKDLEFPDGSTLPFKDMMFFEQDFEVKPFDESPLSSNDEDELLERS